MIKIVFRVDSGNHIGIGHLMRCLTLAYEFKAQGHDIYFVTKNHEGFLKDAIPSLYKVFVLGGGCKTKLSDEMKNNYHSWLGESWEEDLKKTNEVLQEITNVDLVVVDHYSLDEKYEKELYCRKILVIDDLMNREHYCDYLLDQNTSANVKTYKSLTRQKETLFFLGPQYALLKRDFSLFREQSIKRRSDSFKIKKILVFFGGGDIGNDCLRLAHTLTLKELDLYNFTFILKREHPSFDDLSLWAKKYPKSVTLYSFVENMAEVISEHDFFIGAGGATSWERICLGIPSAIIAVADNQVKISESLKELNLAYYLGIGKDVTDMRWKVFFKEKLTDEGYFQEMSKSGLKVVDGKGAINLANAISEGLK